MGAKGAHELPGWLLCTWAWHNNRASTASAAFFAASSTARCDALSFRARRVAAGPMALASAAIVDVGAQVGVGMDAATGGCT